MSKKKRSALSKNPAATLTRELLARAHDSRLGSVELGAKRRPWEFPLVRLFTSRDQTNTTAGYVYGLVVVALCREASDPFRLSLADLTAVNGLVHPHLQLLESGRLVELTEGEPPTTDEIGPGEVTDIHSWWALGTYEHESGQSL